MVADVITMKSFTIKLLQGNLHELQVIKKKMLKQCKGIYACEMLFYLQRVEEEKKKKYQSSIIL